MKKYILLSLSLITLSSSFAQLKDFKFKFYGQIRTDFYYNSRANEETVDGLFYMYPKDEMLDGNGEDLNATSNSNFWGWTWQDRSWEQPRLPPKWKWISVVREPPILPYASVMLTLIWTGESRLYW